jgi:hypothetical protein
MPTKSRTGDNEDGDLAAALGGGDDAWRCRCRPGTKSRTGRGEDSDLPADMGGGDEARRCRCRPGRRRFYTQLGPRGSGKWECEAGRTTRARDWSNGAHHRFRARKPGGRECYFGYPREESRGEVSWTAIAKISYFGRVEESPGDALKQFQLCGLSITDFAPDSISFRHPFSFLESEVANFGS